MSAVAKSKRRQIKNESTSCSSDDDDRTCLTCNELADSFAIIEPCQDVVCKSCALELWGRKMKRGNENPCPVCNATVTTFDMAPCEKSSKLVGEGQLEGIRIVRKAKLGEGGYGTVYDGTMNDNTPIALKAVDLSETTVDRHKQVMARQMAGDPQVRFLVRLLGFCRPVDVRKRHKRYIVMERADGTLHDLLMPPPGSHFATLRKAWQYDAFFFLDLLAQLALILNDCHTRNTKDKKLIYNFDFKPGNVLVFIDSTREGYPTLKLGDLDTMRVSEAASSMPTAMVHTPYFAAPEILDPRTKSVGPEVDVFAFGAIAYCLMYREWINVSVKVCSFETIHLETGRYQDVPRFLVELARQCTSRDPTLRPPASHIAAQLKGFLLWNRRDPASPSLSNDGCRASRVWGALSASLGLDEKLTIPGTESTRTLERSEALLLRAFSAAPAAKQWKKKSLLREWHGVVLDEEGVVVELDLSNSQLTNVDLTQLPPSLKHLDLSNNQLTSVDLTQLPPSMEHLNLSNNQLLLTVLDLTQLPPSLKQLDLSSNPRSSVDTSDRRRINPTTLGTIIAIIAALALAGVTQDWRGTTYAVLDLSNTHLTSIDGLWLPPSLKRLDVSNNHLAEVDLTLLPSLLKELDLSNNHLMRVVLTHLPSSLKSLQISNNQLTSVDLTKLPPSLTNLHLFNNQLTSVDLTQLPSSVEWLYLSNNQLTSVDLAQLPSSLKSLQISNNQLTSVDPTKLRVA